MDKDKLIQFADLDESITKLEEANTQHKEDIAQNVEAIKALKIQKHTLMVELRPAFNLRPGPKAKVERKRKPKKHTDSATDTTVDKS
jgi:hypothetical protein